MTQYPHLHPSTVPLLELSAAERITRCQTKRYVSYYGAETGLVRMERLVQLPRQQRPEGLIIEAPTGNGKSYILERFRQRHPAMDNPEGDHVVVPVLFIEMPEDPSLVTFYEAILNALFSPYNPRSKPAEKRKQAIEVLAAAQTRILLIDEAHNLGLAAFSMKMKILAALRAFMNHDRLMLSIVCAGTSEAKAELQSDVQLLNRFDVHQLPLWQDGESYRSLLAGFEALLPLKRPSDLWDNDDLAHTILQRSDRIIAEMFKIVSRAAVAAIEGGEEQITRKVLDRIDYRSLSQRRNPVFDVQPM